MKRNGFTLIELITVITIVAVLASCGIGVWKAVSSKQSYPDIVIVTVREKAILPSDGTDGREYMIYTDLGAFSLMTSWGLDADQLYSQLEPGGQYQIGLSNSIFRRRPLIRSVTSYTPSDVE